MIELQLKIGHIPYTSSSMLNCQYPNIDTENIFPFEKRLVFMATGTAGGGGGGSDKDDEKEKEKEEEKKREDTEKEKKKREEDEKEKKKKDGEKDEEGEEDTEENLEKTTGSIAEQAKKAAGTAEEVGEHMQYGKSDEEKLAAENMHQIKGKLQNISAEDENIDSPVKKYLDTLVDEGKISRKKAIELLRLDPNSEDFKKDWAKAAGKLSKLPKDSPEMQKLMTLKKRAAKKHKKLEEELSVTTSEMRRISTEMHEHILSKYEQERAIEKLTMASGIEMKEGQALTYVDESSEEKKRLHAKIKKVQFEEVEILDEKGNVIKKVQKPVLTIESIHPATGNKIGEEKFTSKDISRWVTDCDVVEDIDSLKDLKESIKAEIKDGQVLEYQIANYDSSGKNLFRDEKVRVGRIDQDNRTIRLDKPIVTETGSKDLVTFGEFARWYKKNGTVPEIATLEDLRSKLYTFQQVQNEHYKRNPAEYPPIKAEKDEVLYYDDAGNKMFVIKEVNEQEKTVTFDKGEKKSFTGFLRWVKQNQVEKKTADAEAEKAARLTGSPEEKAAIMQEAKADAEKEIAERKTKGAETPEGYVLPSTDEPTSPPISYLRNVWQTTNFMSLKDFWEMGKTVVELAQRKLKRWKGSRIGAVGEAIFGPASKALAAEFKGMYKHAEDEEVQHHVKHFETMGVDDIKHEMHTAGRKSKDVLKAAITVLAKKGAMRWDDKHFFELINDHAKGVPMTVYKGNYYEALDKIFEQWWGAGTFKDFRHSQDSGYKNVKEGFKDHAIRLENDPGGPKLQLQKLMYEFLNGGYVDPAMYEEYLDYTMEYGKMQFEDKMFFLIMGIGATNPNGETLLSVDRAATLSGTYFKNIPLIEFFVSPWLKAYSDDGKPIWDPKTGEQATDRPGVGAYKNWITTHILPDFGVNSISQIRNLKPNEITWKKEGSFVNFVRDVIAFDPYAAVRMEKAAKDTSNWDHDDMDMFVQLLDDSTVDQITRHAGGARQQVSGIGLKNAVAGLNDFVRRKIINFNKKAKEGDTKGAQEELKWIVRLLKNFTLLDAMLDHRYKHAEPGRTRFIGSALDGAPLCDKRPVKEHIAEVRYLLGELAEKLNFETNMGTVMTKLSAVAMEDKKIAATQQDAVNKFSAEIEEKIKGYVAKNNLAAAANLFMNIQENAGALALKGINKQPLSKAELEKEKAAEEKNAPSQTAQAPKTVIEED